MTIDCFLVQRNLKLVIEALLLQLRSALAKIVQGDDDDVKQRKPSKAPVKDEDKVENDDNDNDDDEKQSNMSSNPDLFQNKPPWMNDQVLFVCFIFLNFYFKYF